MARRTGRDVGTLKTSVLAAGLGESLTVIRSEKESPSFPLYLRTQFGSFFFNSRKGQDFLLEHSVMHSAGDADVANEEIESEEDAPPADEVKKKGFWRDFVDGDEDE